MDSALPDSTARRLASDFAAVDGAARHPPACTSGGCGGEGVPAPAPGRSCSNTLPVMQQVQQLLPLAGAATSSGDTMPLYTEEAQVLSLAADRPRDVKGPSE